MKIKVKTYGHQYYSECEGEVLAWVQTVEKFPDNNGGDKYLQVPAVVIKLDDHINVISLNKYL